MKTATDLIGRDRARADLDGFLEAGERCITVRGPGGVGKTSIVKWLADGHDGVFVGLEACRSADDVAAEIADVLKLPDAARNLGGVQSVLGSMESSLLVLDNAEHIADEVATVVDELLRGTTTQFIVTSRVRLGIDSERLYELDPLDPSNGFRLFETRAKTALPTFQVDRSNREDIEDLVELLDGLPLALELAASRVRVLTPGQIMERLGEQFELLKNRRADVERHATLDACIDWSWELLTDEERTTLQQASIFRGGFSMEDAEAVIDVSEWVGDALEHLVEHSLLRVDHQMSRTRFNMYDAVRRYVDRHTTADQQLARRLGNYLLEKSDASALRHADLPNILWVFELSLDFDPDFGVDLLVSARRRLLRGGFEQALLDAVDAAFEREISPVAEARLYVARATAHYARMEYHSCERALEKAAERLEGVPEADKIAPEAQMLLLHAVRLNERHDPVSAEAALARARKHLDELPDSLATHTLAASGISAMKLRDFEATSTFFDQAIERAARTPDIALRARTLSWSSFGPMVYGDLDRAVDRLEEALLLFAKTEDYVSMTQARYTLAQALLSKDPERALIEAREAEQIARKSRMRIFESMTRIFVARVSEPDDAPSIIRQALRVFGDDVSNSDRWSGWSSLVVVYARRGNLSGALGEVQALMNAVRKYGADEDYQRAARYASVVAALADEEDLARSYLVEGDTAFAEALEEVIDERAVSDEILKAFDDPYDRLVLDYLPLPFELYRNVRDKQRRRRTMNIVDEGDLVVLPDGEEIELASRYVLRRLMFALCRFHDENPGQSMTLEELVEAGWPDETMTYESGIRRVYSAIRNIRKLGFEDVVLTGENGYLIDPDLNIVYEKSG